MAIDYYPDEEGSIVDGFICGFCYADNACNAGEVVTWGSSAAGRIAVTPSAAAGDGIGVALKAAAATGSIIPVAFSGIVKLTTEETIAIGNFISNISSITVSAERTAASLCFAAGTHTILGCAMQAGADDDGDEILVLLGGDGLSAGNMEAA
jgi:hypothetical protein